VPEAPLTPQRRRASADGLPPVGRAPLSNWGWSAASRSCAARPTRSTWHHRAALGYDALGIADANSMAGVVRLHSEAKALGLRPVIGCRIETTEGLEFLAYPGTAPPMAGCAA
jgi:error-prone DNA polymerase